MYSREQLIIQSYEKNSGINFYSIIIFLLDVTKSEEEKKGKKKDKKKPK